jgi:hypothetical protein
MLSSWANFEILAQVKVMPSVEDLLECSSIQVCYCNYGKCKVDMSLRLIRFTIFGSTLSWVNLHSLLAFAEVDFPYQCGRRSICPNTALVRTNRRESMCCQNAAKCTWDCSP